VLALQSDGAGGLYVGTGPWLAWLTMGAYLAAPTAAPARAAAFVLGRRNGRLYHIDAGGTRRLIASDLPPVFAIAAISSEGALAGPPAGIAIRPIPTEPAAAGLALDAGSG
jgi:hypothetical protein